MAMKRTKKRPQNRSAVVRDARGRILPGSALNPGGRPKEEREVVELARQHGSEIILKLVSLALKRNNVHAGIEVLNRAYGKAKQVVKLEGSAAPVALNLSMLSDDEVDALRGLLARAQQPAQP